MRKYHNTSPKKHLQEPDLGGALLVLAYEVAGYFLLALSGYVLGLLTLLLIGGPSAAYSLMPNWAVNLVSGIAGVIA